jgi:hypothetical protein
MDRERDAGVPGGGGRPVIGTKTVEYDAWVQVGSRHPDSEEGLWDVGEHRGLRPGLL